MQVKKKDKIKSKKTVKSSDYSQEDIQAVRNWIRKLEQTANSIGSRLAAVERRLSIRDQDYTAKKKGVKITSSDRPLDKIIKDAGEGEISQNIVEVSKIFDNELSNLQEDMLGYDHQIEKLNGQMSTINETLSNIDNKILNLQKYVSQNSTNVDQRVRTLEQKSPPTMKIGKMNVPIEITGLIIGFLLIIISIFLFLGQYDLIKSPIFILIVGIILILSAIIKTIKTSYAPKTITQQPPTQRPISRPIHQPTTTQQPTPQQPRPTPAKTQPPPRQPSAESKKVAVKEVPVKKDEPRKKPKIISEEE